MAISYRDVRRKTEKKLDEKQDKRTQFRAVVVDSLGNQSGAGDIWASRTQRRVWIMTVGGSQPFQVLCVRLTPVIGLGVIVGYADPLSRTLEVLRTDYEFLGPSNTTGTAYESPSNLDFLPGGRLQLWLDTRLIQSLAIYPNSTGLFVNVTDGDYIYQGERKTFNGQTNIDLSGSQPAGPSEHLYIGLYLDSSNTLATVDGATVATSADAPEPTWPAGSYRLGMVLLNDTQTSFSMADDIVNLKIPWTDELSFGSWPFGDVLTVDATNAGANYSTIADAAAVAASGDLILFDGSLACNNVTLGAGVSIAGWSPKTSILTQTSDANCLTVNNAQAFNFSIAMAINSANNRIGLNLTGDLPRVNNVVIDAANAGAGACDGIVSAGTGDPVLTACDSHGDRYALYVDNASSIVTVDGGHYLGGSADVQVNAGFANLLMPYLESGVISAFPATRGQWFDTSARVRTASKNVYFDSTTTAPLNITARSAASSSPVTQDVYLDDGTNYTPGIATLRRYDGSNWQGVGGDYGVMKVKNTSGATRAAGDVGYTTWTTGSGIEFKTTTTANDNRIGSVAAVLVGGANNANIYVTQLGRLTIPYAGSDPAQGNFLVFSTTAGKVALQTTMSPDVVAVAMAAGAGGTVDALLVAGSVFKNNTPAFDIFRCDTASNSDFVATINGAPSGASVTYNAPSSGQEGNLTPASTSQIAKMVLHNTTRGTSALISTVNTGTNVITLTANAPAAWASGDTITIRSQTNTVNPSANVYFMDFEFVSDINDLARYFDTYLFHYDSGTAGQRLNIHPWQTNANSKQLALDTYAAGLVSSVTGRVTLYQKRFCLSWQASGTGTGIVGLRLLGEGVASP